MANIFPPIEKANSDGLLAISPNINTDILITAYKSGIFPWPYEKDHILWFAPPKRAILKFSEFKISRRLLRHINSSNYEFRINTAFPEVIQACASVKRPNQQGTWITQKIIDAYIDLHKTGYAHSFEIFDTENKLIGGLYGIKINNFFAGESMFHTTPNASKFALYETVNYLRTQGLTWLDAQITNPFLESFGIKEISRNEFMIMLQNTSLSPNF
jgi:leucyl/phenylalanyl-tRNA---protein transferase